MPVISYENTPRPHGSSRRADWPDLACVSPHSDPAIVRLPYRRYNCTDQSTHRHRPDRLSSCLLARPKSVPRILRNAYLQPARNVVSRLRGTHWRVGHSVMACRRPSRWPVYPSCSSMAEGTTSSLGQRFSVRFDQPASDQPPSSVRSGSLRDRRGLRRSG